MLRLDERSTWAAKGLQGVLFQKFEYSPPDRWTNIGLPSDHAKHVRIQKHSATQRGVLPSRNPNTEVRLGKVRKTVMLVINPLVRPCRGKQDTRQIGVILHCKHDDLAWRGPAPSQHQREQLEESNGLGPFGALAQFRK
jgi:hypothetical protein